MNRRKILIDVGAHLGETLKVALEPRWGFDAIHCFEPAPNCWEAIEAIADSRTVLHRVGLWSTDATLTLHDPGEIGASLFESKSLSSERSEVSVIDAAEWFRSHIRPARSFGGWGCGSAWVSSWVGSIAGL